MYQPIDPAPLLEHVASSRAGAAVLFLGSVRELTGSQRTLALDYEAHEALARATLADLDRQARERWPIVGLAIVHRLGRLALGEISVAVAVSTPHRAQAFEAGQWIIDTLKEVVPIWKCENFADGSTEWVHPTPDSQAASAPLPTGNAPLPTGKASVCTSIREARP